MKAMVYTTYGSPVVLHLTQVAKPMLKEDEVLIRIHAASANAADWHIVRADPFLARFMSGLLKPKIPFPALTSRGVSKRLVEA